MNGWREDDNDLSTAYWKRISESQPAPYEASDWDDIPDHWWGVLILVELLLILLVAGGFLALGYVALTHG